MGSIDFLSGWDTSILMVPFLGVLVMYMFRLDETFAAPKAASKKRRSFCGADPNDRPYLSDPDGQLWRGHTVRQIEAGFEPAAHSEGRDSICQPGSQDVGLADIAGSIYHI
jgi:hypothetical protein